MPRRRSSPTRSTARWPPRTGKARPWPTASARTTRCSTRPRTACRWRCSRAASGARDRELLRLRFEEDLTQRDIADRVGLSQMHVSRLLRDALGALAERLREDALPAPREAA